MKSLDKALENLKYDSRMVDWNIQNGLISKEELDKHLQALKDLTDQTQKVDLEEDDSYSYSEDN